MKAQQGLSPEQGPQGQPVTPGLEQHISELPGTLLSPDDRLSQDSELLPRADPVPVSTPHARPAMATSGLAHSGTLLGCAPVPRQVPAEQWPIPRLLVLLPLSLPRKPQ